MSVSLLTAAVYASLKDLYDLLAALLSGNWLLTRMMVAEAWASIHAEATSGRSTVLAFINQELVNG
jgi:hypothetical protein